MRDRPVNYKSGAPDSIKEVGTIQISAKRMILRGIGEAMPRNGRKWLYDNDDPEKNMEMLRQCRQETSGMIKYNKKSRVETKQKE